MSSEIRKRSVLIAGHATSISLEAPFWDELKRIADLEGLSLNALVARIDGERTGNLSSALRVFVLERLKSGNLCPQPLESPHPYPPRKGEGIDSKGTL